MSRLPAAEAAEGRGLVRLGAAPRRVAQVYGGFIRSELQAASAYRGQLVVGVFGWVVPLAMMALWSYVGGEEGVGEVSAAQIKAYFLIVLIASSSQIGEDLVFGMSDMVYTGRLSARLLQPVHPMHAVLARTIAEKAYYLPVVVLVVIGFAQVLDTAFSADPTTWLLALGVLVLGIVAMAYVAACVASLAFWLTKAYGVQSLFFGAEWIVGGLVAPVAFLPEPWSEVLRHQPFWFASGGPAELVSGIHDGGPGMLVEAGCWVLGLHLVFAVVWRRGVRSFEAVGT